MPNQLQHSDIREYRVQRTFHADHIVFDPDQKPWDGAFAILRSPAGNLAVYTIEETWEDYFEFVSADGWRVPIVGVEIVAVQKAKGEPATLTLTEVAA